MKIGLTSSQFVATNKSQTARDPLELDAQRFPQPPLALFVDSPHGGGRPSWQVCVQQRACCRHRRRRRRIL